jgi:hypothetical protein
MKITGQGVHEPATHPKRMKIGVRKAWLAITPTFVISTGAERSAVFRIRVRIKRSEGDSTVTHTNRRDLHSAALRPR